MVREAGKEDLQEILELYLCLHEQPVPEPSEHLAQTWEQIIEDKNHHLLVNEVSGQIARENNCYKMMLLTGSKEKKTLDFYKHAGYNSTDKTAFIQWLNE